MVGTSVELSLTWSAQFRRLVCVKHHFLQLRLYRNETPVLNLKANTREARDPQPTTLHVVYKGLGLATEICRSISERKAYVV